MDKISVRFGTPEPIGFREYDERWSGIDLDLEGLVAGVTEITGYDPERYPDPETVRETVKEIALPTLKAIFAEWPEGRSLWRKTGKEEIADCFDRRLAERGITCATEILSFTLTEESRQLFQEAMRWEWERNVRNWPGWDHLDFNTTLNNEGQPVQNPSVSPLPQGMDRRFFPDSDDRGVDGATPGTPVGLWNCRGAPTDKYCRSCGAKRPEGVRFCPECGASFNT